jgi:hypothetical protein
MWKSPLVIAAIQLDRDRDRRGAVNNETVLVPPRQHYEQR